jgi:hypothetical protein
MFSVFLTISRVGLSALLSQVISVWVSTEVKTGLVNKKEQIPKAQNQSLSQRQSKAEKNPVQVHNIYGRLDDAEEESDRCCTLHNVLDLYYHFFFNVFLEDKMQQVEVLGLVM